MGEEGKPWWKMRATVYDVLSWLHRRWADLILSNAHCLFCLPSPMMHRLLFHFLSLVYDFVRFAFTLQTYSTRVHLEETRTNSGSLVWSGTDFEWAFTPAQTNDYGRKRTSIRLKWTKQLWCKCDQRERTDFFLQVWPVGPINQYKKPPFFFFLD